MKIILETTTMQEAIGEIRCNCCGRQLMKDNFGYFEEHLAVTKTWGYGPPVDGETHSFDLCYDCYAGFVEGFEVPPKVDVRVANV